MNLVRFVPYAFEKYLQGCFARNFHLESLSIRFELVIFFTGNSFWCSNSIRRLQRFSSFVVELVLKWCIRQMHYHLHYHYHHCLHHCYYCYCCFHFSLIFRFLLQALSISLLALAASIVNHLHSQ